MRLSSAYSGLAIALWAPLCFAQTPWTGFVPIQGGTFHSGDVVTDTERSLARVDAFEILDHPVTNLDYKTFIVESGYRAPLHWTGGQIPAGKENHPVVFVNIKDADKYLRWLTEKDGRVYRLPTAIEFEYAARGGLVDKVYPWGDDAPQGKANFDADGNRQFDNWQDYLEPVKRGPPNGYGLYDMAGNVWQMVRDDVDPAVSQYIYRFEDTSQSENIRGGNIAGGSWARGAEYLAVATTSISIWGIGIRIWDFGLCALTGPIGEVSPAS